MRRKRAKYSRWYIHPNLTSMQAGLIKRLDKNKTYKVISADKNCGLVIIETEYPSKIMVIDQLGNATTHEMLSKKEAFAQLSGVGRLIESFISKQKRQLLVAAYAYPKRGLK